MSSSLKNDEDPVSERKKLYISERKIPALFEVDILLDETDMSFSLCLSLQALMAGLMNHEPDNHYDFLIQSLSKVV